MGRLSEVDQAVEGSTGTNQAGRDVVYNHFTGIPLGGIPGVGLASVTPIPLRRQVVHDTGHLDRGAHNPQLLHSAQICQGNREELLALKKDVQEIRVQAHAERKGISDMVMYIMIASFGTAIISGVNLLIYVSHF